MDFKKPNAYKNTTNSETIVKQKKSKFDEYLEFLVLSLSQLLDKF